MSLLGRLLGSSRNKAYAKGIALLDAGSFAAAVPLLREAALESASASQTALAGFHFRQALVQEGRRLLRSDQPPQAVAYFAEAAQQWDRYPDLHCLHGGALGLAGRWDEALPAAKTALRLNADYVEARLLEAVALQRLERGREAADSLTALVEVGRRVDHWLISHYRDAAPFDAERLPADLTDTLVRALSGRSEKEEVNAAVVLCRAGRWEEGLERFGQLVQKRPRYPDYRTRLAAALFQVGRDDDALTEVEAALALNENYRTAQDLKGLVLADTGRLQAARDFLLSVDAGTTRDRQGGEHEELFGAYLRATLALLAGELSEAASQLTRWPDLVRHFARAELLLAACDDLLGREDACRHRLGALVAEWPTEPVYVYFLVGHHLAAGRPREAAAALARWPRAASGPDDRPLYLEGVLDLGRGRAPVADGAPHPDATALGGTAAPTALAVVTEPHVTAHAWRLQAAQAALLQGDAEQCWQACAELVEMGSVTEALLRLQGSAALLSSTVPAGWRPLPVTPDSALPTLYHLLVRRDEAEAADTLSAGWRKLHPELSGGWWLSARFWLAPVRAWIA